MLIVSFSDSAVSAELLMLNTDAMPLKFFCSMNSPTVRVSST